LLCTTAGIHEISKETYIVGLPEEQVYTRIIHVPVHNKKDRFGVVLQSLASKIPIENEDMVLQYEVIHEDTDGVTCVVIVMSRTILLQWRHCMYALGISRVIFDVSALASSRPLFQEFPEQGFMIVDMGASTTSVTSFDQGHVRMAYTLATAGNDCTLAIAEHMNISEDEAEVLKKGVALGDADNTSPATVITQTIVDSIIDDVDKSLAYIATTTGHPIEHVYLIGGSSRLGGLTVLFEQKTHVPTAYGKIVYIENATEDDFDYITALGLALRGVDSRWDQMHPSFSASDIHEDTIHTPLVSRTVTTQAKSILSRATGLAEIVRVHTHGQRTRRQIIILVALVCVGTGLVIGLSRYRSLMRQERSSSLLSQLVQYSLVQNIPVHIPLYLRESVIGDDHIRGRVISHVLEISGSYEEARARSEQFVSKQLQEGERLWAIPMDPEPNILQWPLTFRWIAYTYNDVQNAMVYSVNTQNTTSVPYAVNNILIQSILPTDDLEVLTLQGEISISLNEYIDHTNDGALPTSSDNQESNAGVSTEELGTNQENAEDAHTQDNSPAQDTIQDSAPQTILGTLTITQTPTGSLNVRSGPGTTFDKLTTILPGQSYSFVAIQGDWYHILLENDQWGWVKKDYIKVKQ
jgi:Tfp pilus assembly PilM family ATPase